MILIKRQVSIDGFHSFQYVPGLTRMVLPATVIARSAMIVSAGLFHILLNPVAEQALSNFET